MTTDPTSIACSLIDGLSHPGDLRDVARALRRAAKRCRDETRGDHRDTMADVVHGLAGITSKLRAVSHAWWEQRWAEQDAADLRMRQEREERAVA